MTTYKQFYMFFTLTASFLPVHIPFPPLSFFYIISFELFLFSSFRTVYEMYEKLVNNQYLRDIYLPDHDVARLPG
jgi:hypothetical protein